MSDRRIVITTAMMRFPFVLKLTAPQYGYMPFDGIRAERTTGTAIAARKIPK